MKSNSMSANFDQLLNPDRSFVEKKSQFSSNFFSDLLKGDEMKYSFQGKVYYLHLNFENDLWGKRKVSLSDEMGNFIWDIFLNEKDWSWEQGNFKNSSYRSILEELQKSMANTRIALGIDASNEKTSSEIAETLS